MPFQSEKQRRYLWANEPEIARDWTDTYGSRIKKDDGGISQLVKSGPGRPGYGGFRPGTQHAGSVADLGDTRQGDTDRLNQQRALKAEVRKQQKEKEEEKVERFRNKKGLFTNKRTRDFFLDKVLKSGKYGLTAEQFAALGWGGVDEFGNPKQDQEDVYGDYLDARGLGKIDAYGNLLNQPRSGRSISPYPRDVHVGTGDDTTAATDYGFNTGFQDSLKSGATTPDYFVGETPLASNIAWGKRMGADPRTMGLTSWAADGGRISRAYGGIMDTATGRRAYGFGSIFKKIGRAAKKVLKSDVGKAALIGTAMYGANAGWFGGHGEGWWTNMGPWKKGIALASALPFFMKQPEDDEEDKGANYDLLRDKYASELMNIKRGVHAGSLNPNQWSYLPSNYTYTGAEGGRAGYYAGGQSIPSENTIEDARKTAMQDRLGGITDVMKRADLYRQGDVGQMYAANGGRIRYDAGGQTGHPPITMGQIQAPPQMPPQAPQPNPMPAPQPNQMAMMGGMNPMMAKGMNPMMAKGMNPMGGGMPRGMPRRMAQEGGLMDLGGMEKDYRNDGGFVPLGGAEKADDVPARLSKNEFVFTADAVRGAGGGDIDKGAEIMENIMKNLEQGGQISEETQGLSGAQEMFGVSERLSEVV